MSDVSRVAGVSVTTVSHVINGSRAVRDDTTRRVMAAIEQTGYVRNTLARSLRVSETRLIGFAVDQLAIPYFLAVIASVDREARECGYSVLLSDFESDPGLEMRQVQTFVEQRVDAMIISPSARGGASAIDYLVSRNVPVVQIDRIANPRVDYVVAQNREAMLELTAHLLETGHSRVAVIAGDPDLSTTKERMQGYREAHTRAGVAVDPGLLISGEEPDGPLLSTLRLFERQLPPDAIIAGNGTMTIGVLTALKQLGLRVPDDIALVSFDDFPWADVLAPRLTTMAQPERDIGVWAVRALMSRIERPDRPQLRKRLDARLCHRDSCGCGPRTASESSTLEPGELR